MSMEDVKRGRGRPKGSGEDDTVPLMMVARLVAGDTPMKPTTAMKRVRDAGQWPAPNDEALIRRWQVKWKMFGPTYLQRVQDERGAAEAERQRRERVAAEAHFDSARAARDLAAEIGMLWQLMPRHAVGEAVLGIALQNRELAQSFGGAIAGLAERGMLPVRSSAFDTLTKFGLPEAMKGPAIGDVLRAHRAMLDNPGLMETMRKMDAIGRAWGQSGALGQTFKLPKEF